MADKKAVHCYELIIRSQGREVLVLRTCDLAKIKREYNGHRARQVYSRILEDGRELTICEADKLCVGAATISGVILQGPIKA